MKKMRLSQYFVPILKQDPSDAVIASHKLMLRAGLVRQQSAGMYIWLPLGLRVLKKIESIVRAHMDSAQAIEVLMPCIQPEALWEESGRSQSYGEEMLRITDRHKNKLLFGPTNEEVITDLFRNNIKSYKELPKNFYHIQWKFRDEVRPRFGLLRCREFLMKDAYSFDVDRQAAESSYERMLDAYIKIFHQVGLRALPARADSGAIGGDLSHEFHVLSERGESTIIYDAKLEEAVSTRRPDVRAIRNIYSVTDDLHKPENCAPDVLARLKTGTSIEVGHVFYSATKYTDAMNVRVMNESGQLITPHCGCYGIGISRLVATIIEAHHDDNGIVWPGSVAPFDVSLINLHPKDEAACTVADKFYQAIESAKLQVLYDDTDTSPGNKFNSNDLLGMPWQVIVSSKLTNEGLVELKNRKSGEINKLSPDAALSTLLGAQSLA